MSFYTGRYMFSHGAGWNNYPLRVDEWTLGDYLRPLGLRVALAGKTHMKEDAAGMARLGIDPISEQGVLASECGFEPFERDDGLHPDRGVDPHLPYNHYLRQKGYSGDNPWSGHANSVRGDKGEILDGWYWGHSNGAADVREEDSETPYMTDRAIDFITGMGERPWCLHLSYIKPHWPYIAPEPYASLYGPDQMLDVHRDAVERAEPHPVYAAFMRHRDSRLFLRPNARTTIVPAYMGLIKQIDDHFGRLMTEMERLGRLEDTMIVFTSDHGDYLGDHWLGEKDLFHEASVRIPMIVYDPRRAANATRGTVSQELVEAIDLVPTFIEAVGGEVPYHRLEGRSLVPLLQGEKVDWRSFVISESDYSGRDARADLDLAPMDARCFMLRTERWKYILHEKFRPQLFDLKLDPDEFTDLGADPEYATNRDDLHEKLFTWFRNRKLRATISDNEIIARTGGADRQGILIGYWRPEDP